MKNFKPLFPFVFIVLSFFSGLSGYGQLRMTTGTYEGTGMDNETITGLGFQPDVLIIKSEETSNEAQIRISGMPDGYSKQMVGGSAIYTNRIKSFTPDGFILGTNNDVNYAGKRYYYTAFYGGPNIRVGSYTGDGTDGRSIGGVGFQPELVFLIPGDGFRSSWRSASFPDADASAFGSDFNLANTIESLDADGFTVGHEPRANKAGEVFYYAAFKAVESCMKVGSYVGNGVDNHAITGVGFRAQYMFVKSSGSNAACQKSYVMPNLSSIEFSGSRADDNRIHDITADGFVTGTQGQVNTNNRVYHYVCFQDCDPVPAVRCIATGTYIGDGVDNRIISGLGFSPGAVMVKVINGGNEAQMRTSTMASGYCKQMVGGSAQYTNRIKSFTPDGFVIGTNNDVNNPGKTYMWTAFDNSDVLEFGTYIGDGTDNRSITGLGFTPDMIWLFPRTGNKATWRSSTFPDADCSAFGSDFSIGKTLTGLIPNGFTIGNSYRANKIAEVYHYIAFRSHPEFLKLGSYIGDGVAGHVIDVPGFEVQYLFIKSAGGNAAVQKSDQMVTTGSIEFSGSSQDLNRILSMGADGFTVGSPQMVNKAGQIYHYGAFNACAPLLVRPVQNQGRPARAEIFKEVFSVFPNPAGSHFNISLSRNFVERGRLEILDLAGRNIKVINLSLAPGLNTRRVEVSGIPAGTYLLRYTGESGGILTKKLVIGR